MDVIEVFQDCSSSSCDSSSGSERGFRESSLGGSIADLCRAASALLPASSSPTSSLCLSRSTSSSQLSSGSQSSSHRSNGSNLIQCHICPYYTNRRSNLVRHLETMHRTQNGHSLECCDVMFANKSELREHKRQVHADGYSCMGCFSKPFARRALLLRHMNVHSGHKEFSCQCCGYATSHKSNLERHIYRLHGEVACKRFKGSRTTHKPKAVLERRYNSLPSGLEGIVLRDTKSSIGHLTESPKFTATGKPRLCSTSYRCPTCSQSFSSQIEESAHSATCGKPTNNGEDTIDAAVILLQLKHSRD